MERNSRPANQHRVDNRPPYQGNDRPCEIREAPAYEGLGPLFGVKLIIEREK